MPSWRCTFTFFFTGDGTQSNGDMDNYGSVPKCAGNTGSLAIMHARADKLVSCGLYFVPSRHKKV